ncbi:MAG TPA: GNAT family N-acetyltransferase [Pirellulales bacterium]|nr:GNAT family N-acetyltransferase [Pirellulales bacterium]
MLSTLPIEARSLRVVAVRDETEFESLRAPWSELDGDVPFRGWEWMLAWWRHYRDSHSKLLTLLATDEHGAVMGIAPWYVHSSPRHGRVVRFLGSGEVCSDYLTLLCREGRQQQVANAIGDWLATDGAREWHLLDLTGVEATDPAINHLGGRLAEHGRIVDRQTDLNCWRTTLTGNWDRFLQQLSKSRRIRTCTLVRRAIENGRAVVHHVKTASDLERGFEILIDLHQKRRRSLSQAGCFASPRFTEFHREMAGRFLASGKLHLFWIELGGRPLSAQYCFVGGQSVYYYQGGFEPELANESPGWLSLATSIRWAIGEGYTSYDFLRGDESYKTSWKATSRPLVHVRVFGRQPSARVRYATWCGSEKFKGWAKQLRSRAKG